MSLEEPGVAASQVENAALERRAQRRDGFAQTLRPDAEPDALERRIAEQILVALVVTPRVVPQLEVGNQAAIEEQGRADAGAEGEHQLHAFAFDHGEPLHVGVVRGVGGLAGEARDLSRDVDPDPRSIEVRGGARHSMLDDAGETDGDAVVPR